MEREKDMATKTRVLFTDDIDGGEATETVTFSLDGQMYEIDLSEKNAGELRKAVYPYMSKARRLRGTQLAANRAKASTPRGTGKTTVIRAWAKNKGIKVNERGRIPASVIEQYEAAH